MADKWSPITSKADLKQPPGLYWTTFISEGRHYIGSDRIYGGFDDELSSNTVAYMRIEEPNPWVGK